MAANNLTLPQETIVPYFKQETEWTCGAACMRMLLGAVGIKRSEKQLIRLLGTSHRAGTPPSSFPKLAEQYSLSYVVHRNSDLAHLHDALHKGYHLMVCYYCRGDGEDHFAVIKQIDQEHVLLLDPWYGPDHKFNLDYFHRIWRAHPRHDNHHRWFFGVLNKPKI